VEAVLFFLGNLSSVSGFAKKDIADDPIRICGWVVGWRGTRPNEEIRKKVLSPK